LAGVISSRREAICKRWLDRIFGEYPAEGAKFLRDQRDPFANPVGAAFAQGTADIVDGLFEGHGEEQLAAALDRVVRVRAVQELTPAQAVGFLFHLKSVVREELAAEVARCSEELARFDEGVDRLVLIAFNVFTACREELYTIRVNAIQNRSLKMMERLNDWRGRRYGTAGDGPAELDS